MISDLPPELQEQANGLVATFVDKTSRAVKELDGPAARQAVREFKTAIEPLFQQYEAGMADLTAEQAATRYDHLLSLRAGLQGLVESAEALQ